jgi:glycosyltransferase involved in cell wall biosynthesis
MNKGTIIYLGAFEFPDKNPAAHRVVSNAKAIRELGYDVVFIGVNKIISEECVKGKYFGFDVFSRKYPNDIIDWLKYITTYRFYLKIIGKYNNVKAIICYNSPSVSMFLLYKWGKKKNIKVIADCTEWYEVAKGEQLIKKIIKKLDISCRMHIVQPKLYAVIAISSYIENFYKNKKTKTIQIPPLTDTSENKWFKDFITVSEYKNIVYVGAPFSIKIKRQKDRLDQLIEALLSYEDQNKFIFHIVGTTKEDFLAFYPVFLEKLNGKDDIIKFYGKLTHKKAINKIKECDFFMFVRDDTLTNRAGFPTKFAEAISCGLPVLTNRNSNVEDYLLEGKNGFFINNDTKEKLIKSLKKPLSLGKDELLMRKKEVYRSKLFDYRNYIDEFKKIL